MSLRQRTDTFAFSCLRADGTPVAPFPLRQSCVKHVLDRCGYVLRKHLIHIICGAIVQTKHDLADVCFGSTQGVSVPRLVHFSQRRRIRNACRSFLRY
ncbi:hypothetical protein JTE90_014072 [Oedothorax gibbosus]|uniref:Uncharacterized protein n=1 Tax=Oedothorax gibbosus TaxID=931172 RepID=A0AAV6TSP2_9ARAC|nr:hypothetical protein JTE90_014072 [Oedothorax gibbosus]